jgi:hypothetical protein
VPTTGFEDGMQRYVDWYLAEMAATEEQVGQA